MNLAMMTVEQLDEDYHRVERAIRYIEEEALRQPSLGEIAEAAGLSEFHFQRLFSRWVGISPKRFLQFITKEYARKHGYVKTPFGRKIHLKYINEKNQGMRAFSERAAINAPLQGGAADIIKRAMIRLPGALKAAKLKAQMLLQVHDELLFEVPDKEIDRTKDLARTVMEGAAKLSVPLVVDTGVGANWAAAH